MPDNVVNMREWRINQCLHGYQTLMRYYESIGIDPFDVVEMWKAEDFNSPEPSMYQITDDDRL